ncbi:putative pyridoxal phosphate-dependent aminotransferase EpsN [Pullulanibacillus camelliae]|uniref:Putative pyridoxal phosphate-dependent aminotransferase EpsN n=1 Tax=Pullulanibacillus camelliae TaxID=1707096 RepID=A0A8J2YF39_9BACL|nr:aminotransferase class I/II-fold pyridoxal phosphate-dependent enzyme [Pullulanibacillus camelliae]GGE30509.1 putative pyridoxal phosphate-dependent aminotransferase EpsN [Pullulanibacillus camelliae]
MNKKKPEIAQIFLSPPHLTGAEQYFIQQALTSNWIAPLGPHVDAFENEIVDYVGGGEAVAVSSGTAAIHLSLALLNLEPGDKVFCSTLTFIASANPILYERAIPVFIDSEPDSWNMSPQALERALREADQQNTLPKAVIVVNLYGQSAKYAEILALCQHYDITVIEDAAESLGATYKGQASGTFGRFGIYSFNGNKIITTSGGGMLISQDKAAIQKARFLSAQARDPAPYYQHSRVGYNYRLSNILAGIGRGQLETLDERVKKRRTIFATYAQELSALPGVHFMKELEHARSNRWLTALTIEEEQAGLSPGELIAGLATENIEARHVWKPLHLQPLFKDARFYPHEEGRSVSEALFECGLCLPSGSNLSSDDQARVIHAIKRLSHLSGEKRVKSKIG